MDEIMRLALIQGGINITPPTPIGAQIDDGPCLSLNPLTLPPMSEEEKHELDESLNKLAEEILGFIEKKGE